MEKLLLALKTAGESLKSLVTKALHPLSDLMYHTFGVGQAMLNSTTGFLSGFVNDLPGALMGIGLTTALSAGITQVHYRRERDEIRELYREELAEKLGKRPKDVTDKDLDILAKGDSARGIEPNRTLAGILHKINKPYS